MVQLPQKRKRNPSEIEKKHYSAAKVFNVDYLKQRQNGEGFGLPLTDPVSMTI